jgi:hypothetical protein
MDKFFQALDLPDADYRLLLSQLGANSDLVISTGQRCDRSICEIVSHALCRQLAIKWH